MQARARARRAAQAVAAVVLAGGSGAILGACSTSASGRTGAASPHNVAKTSSATGTGGWSVLSGEMQAGSGAVVPIVLQRDDTSGVMGTVTGKPDWPRYAPSMVTVPAAKQVTLVIDNFDDMTTPLPSALTNYENVQGGVETVNGQTVSSVSNTEIAHTFTVPELGINVPVPAATDQKSGTVTTVVPAVVTFTFTPAKSGTFTWHCYTPCGTGSAGTGGPMATPGWMEGTLRVAA